jgi:hypothetical protein
MAGGQMCFQSTMIGVDIETYHSRISRFVLESKWENAIIKKGKGSSPSIVWFMGLVKVVLLVIGGVEIKPDLQVEVVMINQILAYVENREK